MLDFQGELKIASTKKCLLINLLDRNMAVQILLLFPFETGCCFVICKEMNKIQAMTLAVVCLRKADHVAPFPNRAFSAADISIYP